MISPALHVHPVIASLHSTHGGALVDAIREHVRWPMLDCPERLLEQMRAALRMEGHLRAARSAMHSLARHEACAALCRDLTAAIESDRRRF